MAVVPGRLAVARMRTLPLRKRSAASGENPPAWGTTDRASFAVALIQRAQRKLVEFPLARQAERKSVGWLVVREPTWR